MAKPLESKRRASDIPVEQSRETPSATELKEMDSEIADQLAERYSHVASPERIRAMKNLPTSFETRKEFEENLRRQAETVEPGSVLGWSASVDEPAHVATDSPDIRNTITHERLHQLSHPNSGELLGTRVDEGITEMLAQRESKTSLEDRDQAYIDEQRSAKLAESICGRDVIEKAYFKGDRSELQQCLETKLNPETAERLRKQVNQRTDTERQH